MAMTTTNKKRRSFAFIAACFLLVISNFIFTACETEAEEPPTKSSMEGVWAVTEAYNENNESIIDQLEFPIVSFHLSSDNTVISTAGPMFMYIVYGENKYTNISSKVDQVFNYAGLAFNGGEFFIKGGVQDRFTLELKLEGLPGQKALTTLLDLVGVTNDYLDLVVYHKFMDVKVSFDDEYNTMIWEWDDVTQAVYNSKDSYGNYVLWYGWPINQFSKCRFVLTKQVKSLTDVVNDAK